MWKKWLIFVFTLCGFITTQLFVNNVSAVSDVSYTSIYNGSNFPEVGNFCNNDSNLPNCTDYDYLVIESSTLTIQNLISANGLAWVTPMAYTDYSIIKIPSDWTRVGFFGVSISGKSTSDYIKFTLTNTIGTPAEPCPEPEPQEPCEDDTNFIVALFKDGFWVLQLLWFI